MFIHEIECIFFSRLSQRHPDNVSMAILNGNNSLLSGTYKYSLCEYMNAFKLDQTNPLISLMLGITFVHMACQKFSARKHALVVQVCEFILFSKSFNRIFYLAFTSFPCYSCNQINQFSYFLLFCYFSLFPTKLVYSQLTLVMVT